MNFRRLIRSLRLQRDRDIVCSAVGRMTRRVAEYSNIVGRHGPDSERARAVRERYADDPEFLRYADAPDSVKRAPGGSGIDYEPKVELKP